MLWWHDLEQKTHLLLQIGGILLKILIFLGPGWPGDKFFCQKETILEQTAYCKMHTSKKSEMLENLGVFLHFSKIIKYHISRKLGIPLFNWRNLFPAHLEPWEKYYLSLSWFSDSTSKTWASTIKRIKLFCIHIKDIKAIFVCYVWNCLKIGLNVKDWERKDISKHNVKTKYV